MYEELVQRLNERIVDRSQGDKYGYERHVHLIGTQPGYCEELYRTQETKSVLIRQDLGEGLVRWLTASKWTGGYEADIPVKSGLTIIAVDKNGKEKFREKTFRTEWNGSGQADKQYPFDWEDQGKEE